MKKKAGRSSGMVKGAPSGVVISLVVHAVAFMLAGMFVVFTVQKKEEKKFVPPKPVDRPKMKLRKPKVKVKKNVKPKPTKRIVTKVKRASMPDIQLPEMSGITEGLVGGIGGFELMPDVESLSLLGSTQSTGSDLQGTYYDLKLNRSGSLYSTDMESFRYAMIDFVRKGFKASTLSRYYRSPNKIYASCLVVPSTLSSIAPAAFGDRDASGAQWMVHYKGRLVHKEGITFRFWAAADETILVRLNGKFVIGAKWASTDSGWSNVEPDTVSPFWESSSMQSLRFVLGNSRSTVGDWITLEPGVPQDIDIVIGDNGGQANFYLAVEEKGVEYPKNTQGGPILPAFKTSEISRDMLDIIYKGLVPGELCLTNGPVFNDYSSASSPAVAAEPQLVPVPQEPEPEEGSMRAWTVGGRSFEAEFMTRMADKVVLKSGHGKTKKILLSALSESDRRFVELASPPKFNVDFIKLSKQKTFVMSSYDENNIRPPEKRCHYGVRLKQTSTGDYNHNLTVELFAVGQERLGQKYILLDRQVTSFVPTRENDRSLEYLSEHEVVLENFEVDGEPRGETYATYLVTITDERGKVVGMETGSDWLYENLDNLRQLHPGNYMDKTCTRVFPTQPPKTRY